MLNERFWSKVAVKTDEDCWEWQANRNNKGYGMFSVNSYVGKKLAHRLSYESVNGKIPDGMHIMHACDNPCCVNPKHLSAGTASQNAVDSVSKGRHPKAIITNSTAISLMRDYVMGMNRHDISIKYGVEISSVSDYTSGRSWKHLHGKHGCPTLEELREASNTKPGSILTPEIVLEIREKLKQGAMGKDLANEYGMHKATISDIKLRKTWNDI